MQNIFMRITTILQRRVNYGQVSESTPAWDETHDALQLAWDMTGEEIIYTKYPCVIHKKRQII